MLSKVATIKALRRRQQDGVILYKSLEPQLRRAVLFHWGTMSLARKALGLLAPSAPRQRWSRERVLGEIRRLDRAGYRLSASELVAIGRNDLLIASYKYAGGWRRARLLAGASFKPRRRMNAPIWDEGAIIKEIKARQAAGLPLATSKAPKALTLAGRRWFGSWREAITAAGIDYETVLLLKTRTDVELVKWLRKLARRKPNMTINELDRHGEHAVICRRRWGSLEGAARAAGLRGWPKRERHHAMSRSSVIAELKKRAKAGALSMRVVRRSAKGYHLINSVVHHFVDWDHALRAAGLR